MWLRNYYNLLTAMFLCDDSDTSEATPIDYTPPIRVKRPNGSYKYTKLSDFQQYRLDSTSVSLQYTVAPFLSFPFIGKEFTAASAVYGCGVKFGTGTNPVTYDDYNLQSAINSGLTIVSNTGSRVIPTELVDGKIHSMRQYGWNNTSGNTLTLTEMGIFVLSGVSDECLVYREVFEPIVLEPNETILIQFERLAEPFNYQPY